MKYFLLMAILMVAACKDSQADSDVGLYDPVAPDDSAFVRFINLTDQEANSAISGKKYEAVLAHQVSPYYVFPAGNVKIKINQAELSEEIIAGDFYSIAYNERVSLIKDTGNSDRSKSTIAFYNLSNNPALTLKAKDGSVNVIESVLAGQTKSRDMNAVKVDFNVYEGDKKLSDLAEVILERGNHYSIIYDGQKVQFITAKTDTRK